MSLSLYQQKKVARPKNIKEVKEVKAKINAVDVAQFQYLSNLPKGVKGTGLNHKKHEEILEDFERYYEK